MMDSWSARQLAMIRADRIKELEQQNAELQRQLDEVTKERDYYKQALELADALRNNAHAATSDRRQWRRK